MRGNAVHVDRFLAAVHGGLALLFVVLSIRHRPRAI